MEPRASAFWVDLKAKRWLYTLSILATLAVGILIGSVVSYGVKGKEGQQSSDAKQLSVPAPQQLSNTFSQIAKTLEPAVVNINTESTIKNPHRQRRGARPGPGDEDNDPNGGGGGGSPFDDFFDRFFGGPGGQGGPGGGDIKERSLGSGVLVDPKGYIVTNRHVIEKADRIRVRLQDDPPGVQHDAKVVGSDQETDLAVIRIELTNPTKATRRPKSATPKACRWATGFWPLAVPLGCRPR
jgi:serine protease Do